MLFQHKFSKKETQVTIETKFIESAQTRLEEEGACIIQKDLEL